MSKTYDVQDILDVGYNLEPLECRYCKSQEVEFLQYMGDAYCSSCGRWQLEAMEILDENNNLKWI